MTPSYCIFTLSPVVSAPSESNKPIVFLEVADGVRRFSKDRLADKAFYEFSRKVYQEEPLGSPQRSLQRFCTGFTYYDEDFGDYAGEGKAKVDRLVQSLGYTLEGD